MKTSLRRGVLRISTAAATAAALALGFASPAGAVGTIDQAVPNDASRPAGANWYWYAQMAQTFTAGRTGQMDRIGLFEGAAGVPTPTPTGPSFKLQIWTVDTSQPSLTAKGSVSSYSLLSYTGSNDWHYFGLSPAVPVTSGTQYAIVVLPVRQFTLKWSYMSPWNYGGGAQWTCCDLQGKWMKSVDTINFAFQTYVTGGAPAPNTPPTLGLPAQSAVQANEGAAPANTGSYSDADGDTVALTATSGSLTRTGTSSGTWSWTQPASDEAPTETVTIKADDGHGNVASTQFTVDVLALTAGRSPRTAPPTRPPEPAPRSASHPTTRAHTSSASPRPTTARSQGTPRSPSTSATSCPPPALTASCPHRRRH